MPFYMRIIEVVIIVLMGVALVALFSSLSNHRIILNKDDWVCKNEKSVLRMQPSVKVMVPITEKHCIEYIKKEY